MVVAYPNKLGKNAQKWPPVWNFGRVVRNALSHNGSIHFENMNAKPVTWHNLSFDPTHNGRAIFDDIDPVDLILLMAEMDGELGPE
jgi:hypothetical protein